jgi:hypothetical protein
MSTAGISGMRTTAEKTIGMLVLDTAFERLPGDAGLAATWRFPVRYATICGIGGMQAMADDSPALLDAVMRAADELVAAGVSGLATTCGFLARFQRELAARCPVPIVTSSLLQIPQVTQLLAPGKRVGILAARTEGLTPALFAGLGLNADFPAAGLPDDSLFLGRLLGRCKDVDPAVLEDEVVRMARGLVRRHPDIGALVLECANFPPYSATLQRALGLPVFDLVTLVEWFYTGLSARRYC